MNRGVIGAAVLTTGVLALAGPAEAAEPVHIEAETSIDEVSPFTSTIQGCESGTVVNGRFSFAGTPAFGIFNGFKHFTCADGSRFTIRLQATFDDTGSTGTWAFVGGTHAGAGTLVGVPFEEGEGITDIYDGTLRP
jgi:hypothetical protein